METLKEYNRRRNAMRDVLLRIEEAGKELDMSMFVAEWGEVGGAPCGTACCHAGWLPRFLPEAGIRWVDDGAHDIEAPDGTHDALVMGHLQDWLGLPMQIVCALFQTRKHESVDRELFERVEACDHEPLLIADVWTDVINEYKKYPSHAE